MENHYDIIIIGKGLVGASLAIALSGAGIKIALVDDSPANSGAQERSIVLSHTSKQILQSLHLWQQLKPQVCPIKHIHVSERFGFGFTRMDASNEKLNALGYVTSAKNITASLNHRLDELQNIKFIPGKFISSENFTDHSAIRVQTKESIEILTAQLIVAADGQNSSVRNNQNISVKTFDYGHKAIISRITLKRDHQHIAYERFTDLGSIAMLPLNDQFCSLIWAIPNDKAEQILALDDSAFLKILQEYFGYRLGKLISCTPRKAIPLQLVTAAQQIQPRLVLLGNAAHTLHPIAGQGLNLGWRDMAVLAEVIVAAFNKGNDIGAIDLLQNYLKRRRDDQLFITHFTHQLVGVFANTHLPFTFLRDMGLILIEIISPLKHYLIEKALGKSNRLPRLACGLSLG